VVCYHDYAAEASGDALLELVDYCCRRLAWLVSRTASGELTDVGEADMEGLTAKEVAAKCDNMVPHAETDRQLKDMLFRASIAVLTLLRLLTEHAGQNKLPVSVLSRMLDANDVMLMMVPVRERMRSSDRQI
jgi:hypothetical protein